MVLRYEAHGHYIETPADRAAQYAAGQAAVLARELAQAGVHVVDRNDAHRVIGAHQAATSLGLLRSEGANALSDGDFSPRYDGLDAVRMGGESFAVARDDHSRPVSPDDTLSELNQATAASAERQRNRWKTKARDPAPSPELAPEGTVHREPHALGFEGDLGADDWSDRTAAAQQAMTARQKTAWLRNKRTPPPVGG